jgi:hypothetical protein
MKATCQAAIDVFVDRPGRLKLLAKDFVNDRSQIVRDEDGTGGSVSKDDCCGCGLLGYPKARRRQAMLKIFNSCDVNVIEAGLADSIPGRKLSDGDIVFGGGTQGSCGKQANGKGH